MQARLIEQRVRHRHEREIDRRPSGGRLQRFPGIDADAEGLDVAGALQLLQRADAAVEKLTFMSGESVAVKAGVEVVDDERVDRVEREPLQRLFVGAHDAVIGVVEMNLEIQAAGPGIAAECLEIFRPVKRAPDLGGDLKFGSRLGTQEAAQPMLREASPVPRRSVEIAHAGLPGGLESCSGIAFGDKIIELGEMGGSKSEDRELQRGGAHLPASGNRRWHR